MARQNDAPRQDHEHERTQAECPHCEVPLLVPRNYLAKRVRCPRCNAVTILRERGAGEEAAARKPSAEAGRTTDAPEKSSGGFMSKFGLGRLMHARGRRQLLGKFKQHLEFGRPCADMIEQFRVQAAQEGVSLADLGRQCGNAPSNFVLRALTQFHASSQLAAPESVRLLRTYCSLLDVSKPVLDRVQSEVGRATTLQQLSEGKAAPMPPESVYGLTVKGSEVVWHQTEARSVHGRKGAEENLHDGRLHVTSVRVIFTSHSAPHEILLSAVDVAEADGRRLYVTARPHQASQAFVVADPELTCAYIRHAVAMFQQQGDVGMPRDRSQYLTPQ